VNTSKPPVLVTRRIPSVAMARLEETCDVEVFNGAQDPQGADLIAALQLKQGLVTTLTTTITREVLNACPDLRVVANIAVGYNNIDVAAARERGVVVTNTPDVLTEASADLTWALILGITRRIVEGDRLVRRGGWKGFALDFMLGNDLRGKQLGVIGFGRIGQAVAARASAFGMRVAYQTRKVMGPPEYQPMPYDRLIATSDVVTVHCPLTEETRHLVDQKSLARMKRSAYLINTARGPVVDEAALVWALKNRIIAGAALDVYEDEPRVHPELLTLENVVLAPHLGSATIETRTAMADLAVHNVVAVLTGNPPLTPVT
jgi:glyoxylate reductase